jgi:hypothetical protein
MMTRLELRKGLLLSLCAVLWITNAPAEPNKERLSLDDMVDVSDWYNGSPDETEVSSSRKHKGQSGASLLFANTVDHTRGEKNYPIGWPRTGKDVAKAGMGDWSGYDFFECRIFAETGRASFPGTPLGVGFYHTGHKRSSHFKLDDVKKNAWVDIVIPIDKLIDASDVRRVQFNITESNYAHGDRADFFINDLALTRFVKPVIVDLSVDRRLLYSSDSRITACFKLMGRHGVDRADVELEIGTADRTMGQARRKAVLQGEISLVLGTPLPPGHYWARLVLRDPGGKPFDRRETSFRVIQGPFQP